MRKFLKTSALAALLIAGCTSTTAPKPSAGLPLRYHNSQYGLTFFLPADWRGYSVVTQQWDGYPSQTERGLTIILRHPQWKTNDLYQDIPIMIFTRPQWDKEVHGQFFPYAGGAIFELWHNQNYVFGLYSRYNFADEVKGWKEAGDIIDQNRAANPMPHLYPQ